MLDKRKLSTTPYAICCEASVETNQERGIKFYVKQSLHTITWLTVQQVSSYAKESRFVEKSSKKYKTTAGKKRREKLFEEKNMIMLYLKRERISAERVPTE